jgi:hypothetical protein
MNATISALPACRRCGGAPTGVREPSPTSLAPVWGMSCRQCGGGVVGMSPGGALHAWAESNRVCTDCGDVSESAICDRCMEARR